ncbi:MAG: shikimate dehydrogenase family protein [Oscillospiraceae bacterium]
MRGVNCTIPHKIAVMEYLDELSESARLIGAVNTIVNDNGRLYGDNTDGKGFMMSLQSNGVDVRGKRAVVFGAGGAARAICVEMVPRRRGGHHHRLPPEAGAPLARRLWEIVQKNTQTAVRCGLGRRAQHPRWHGHCC